MRRTVVGHRLHRNWLIVFVSLIVIVAADANAATRRRSRGDAGQSLLEFRVAMVQREASFGSARVQSVHEAKFGDAAALTWGLEAARFPLRIPKVGGVGIGVGLHLHHHESVGSAEPDGPKTIFQLLPIHTYVIAQLDGPAHCCSAMLVPHAKLGVVAAPWKLRRTEDKVVDQKEKHVDTTIGSGTASGVAYALGLRLSFGAAGTSDRNALGVRHTCVFAEHARMPMAQSDDTRLGLTFWTGGIAAQW